MSSSSHGLRLAVVAVLATVLTTPAAQGQDRLSASYKGSMFILPSIELRFGAQSDLIQDVFVHLTNDFPQDVTVQMVFVNGDPPLDEPGVRSHPGWNWIDNQLFLTANQPTYWSAAFGLPAGVTPFTALDPGIPAGRPDPEGSGERVLRGYIIGWATSGGQEIRWNHLVADVTTVNYADGTAWTYSGYHVQSLGPVGNGDPTGTPGVLNMDGVEFQTAYDQLVFNFAAVNSSAYSIPGSGVATNVDLTLLPLSMDLRQASGGPVTTRAEFDIWNQNEVKFSGTQRCLTCWDQFLLGDIAGANSFLNFNLQTDVGKARTDGLAAPGCDGPGVTSENVALVGVLERKVSFDNLQDRASAGLNLVGFGSQNATVLYDTLPAPPDGSVPTPPAPATVVAAPAGAPEGVSPARADVSAKGSVFILPNVELVWDENGKLWRDTFIHLTNDFPGGVQVMMYFVNGDPPLDEPGVRFHPGWNRIDNRLSLTANQPTYWSALSGMPAAVSQFTALDPGFPPGRPDPDGGFDRVLRGYVVGWAVNSAGEEIRWNHLLADAVVVDHRAGTAWAYSGHQLGAVAPVANGAPTGTPGVLNLDGLEFALPPNELVLNFLTDGSLAYGGTAALDLTMMPYGADLSPGAAVPRETKADLRVWNQNEVQFAGMFRCVACRDETQIANYGPPNNMLRTNLQTDAGKTRIGGEASVQCPDSVDAPLLAVLRTDVSGPGIEAAAGTHAKGLGTEIAAIRFADPPPCPGDITGDGVVDVNDLIEVVINLGPCAGCPADLNGDGMVDVIDYIIVIIFWGPCPVQIGKCCLPGGTCIDTTFGYCFLVSGTYSAGSCAAGCP